MKKTEDKPNDTGYRGMHNGTVRGKGFEASRRARKSHAQRKADHVSAALSRNKN